MESNETTELTKAIANTIANHGSEVVSILPVKPVDTSKLSLTKSVFSQIKGKNVEFTLRFAFLVVQNNKYYSDKIKVTPEQLNMAIQLTKIGDMFVVTDDNGTSNANGLDTVSELISLSGALANIAKDENIEQKVADEVIFSPAPKPVETASCIPTKYIIITIISILVIVGGVFLYKKYLKGKKIF